MNRLGKALIAVGMLCFGQAHATVRYTEARIIEIETSDQEIYLFLEILSGDAPPVGNGGTNSLPNRPYLFLATNATEIANRKHMLASALAAHSTGAVVRIRWDDASTPANRVEYLLTRN